MQFSPEKRKWIHSLLSTRHSGRWIKLQDRILDLPTLQKHFHLSQNIYHATEKKCWS